MKNVVRFALAAAAVVVVAGCQMTSGGGRAAGTGPTARADLKPTANNITSGWVQFAQRGDRVLVTAEVRGLKPSSEHGFHVHDKGDCSSPDAMSAGGHFNPGNKPHAHHSKDERHAGDMPNLKADDKGIARYSFETNLLSIKGVANAVVGRSVVVHRDPDDYTSQPAGNSGPRLACGVVSG